MYQCYRKLTIIPSFYAFGTVQLGVWDVELLQSLGDTDKIMLEPVRHQKRLVTGGFDDVLQRIELSVVNRDGATIVSINSAVCHLAQLAGESGSIGSGNITGRKLQYEILLQFVVSLFLIIGELHCIFTADELRHF